MSARRHSPQFKLAHQYISTVGDGLVAGLNPDPETAIRRHRQLDPANLSVLPIQPPQCSIESAKVIVLHTANCANRKESKWPILFLVPKERQSLIEEFGLVSRCYVGC